MELILLNSEGLYTFHQDQSFPSVDLSRDLETAREQMETHRKNGVLLLEGGADINPKLYGQSVTHAWISPTTKARDTREKAYFEIAKELDMPIFGICRGHQLMAALEGGTLHQDLDYSPYNRHNGWGHELEVFGELSNFRESWTVNTLHHQCIDRMPENAEVIARAEDGLIEGALYKTFKGISFQFHPEFMNDTSLVLWAIEHLRNR